MGDMIPTPMPGTLVFTCHPERLSNTPTSFYISDRRPGEAFPWLASLSLLDRATLRALCAEVLRQTEDAP